MALECRERVLTLVVKTVNYDPPWIARVAELQSNAAINVDAERKVVKLNEEMRDLVREMRTKVRSAVSRLDFDLTRCPLLTLHLRAQDQSYQESAVKIELMEKRMESVKKQAEAITELEGELVKSKKQERAYEEAIEALQGDLDTMEQEINKLKQNAVASDKQGACRDSTGAATDADTMSFCSSRCCRRRSRLVRRQHGDVVPHRADRIPSLGRSLPSRRELVPQVPGPPHLSRRSSFLHYSTSHTLRISTSLTPSWRTSSRLSDSHTLLRTPKQAALARGSTTFLHTTTGRLVFSGKERLDTECEGTEESVDRGEGANEGVGEKGGEVVGDAETGDDDEGLREGLSGYVSLIAVWLQVCSCTQSRASGAQGRGCGGSEGAADSKMIRCDFVEFFCFG